MITFVFFVLVFVTFLNLAVLIRYFYTQKISDTSTKYILVIQGSIIFISAMIVLLVRIK